MQRLRPTLRTVASVLACSAISLAPFRLLAQQSKVYQPTIESLDSHPLPQWYDDAKLGVMIVWGLYSVPGWGPVQHPDHDFANPDFLKYDPYAEWYYNASRIPGSPTEAYNREHFGADHNYYDFANPFNKESRKWDADKMAATLADAGVKYVILTTSFMTATCSGTARSRIQTSRTLSRTGTWWTSSPRQFGNMGCALGFITRVGLIGRSTVDPFA